MCGFSKMVGASAMTLAIALQAGSQTSRPDEQEVGLPPIGILPPTHISGLAVEQAAALRAQLVDLATRQGLSGIAYGAKFLLTPRLSTLTERTADAGMRPLVFVRGRLTLSVSEGLNGVVFNSISREVSGSGRDRDEALMELATTALDDAGEEVQTFFRVTRRRILDHYERSCDGIVSDVRRLLTARQHEEAFLLAMSVPREAHLCAPRMEPLVDRAFSAYEREQCMTEVSHAAALGAVGDLQAAAEHVTGIDATGPCRQELDAMIRNLQRSRERSDAMSVKVVTEAFRTMGAAAQASAAAARGGSRATSAPEPHYTAVPDDLSGRLDSIQVRLRGVTGGVPLRTRDEENAVRLMTYRGLQEKLSQLEQSGDPVPTGIAPPKKKGG